MVPVREDRMDETEGGFEITEERKKKKGSEWDNGGRGKRRGGKESRKDEPEPKRGRRILGADSGRGNISWRSRGPGPLDFD